MFESTRLAIKPRELATWNGFYILVLWLFSLAFPKLCSGPSICFRPDLFASVTKDLPLLTVILSNAGNYLFMLCIIVEAQYGLQKWHVKM